MKFAIVAFLIIAWGSVLFVVVHELWESSVTWRRRRKQRRSSEANHV